MRVRWLAGSKVAASGDVPIIGDPPADAIDARFYNPKDIAFDPLDPSVFYFCDYYNDRIRWMDLDTNKVGNFAWGLPSHPWHIAMDENYVVVTTQNGPDDGNLWHCGPPFTILLYDRNGTLLDSDDTRIYGAVARNPYVADTWLVKSDLYQWDNRGWHVVTTTGGTMVITDEGGYSDGAYPGDAGIVGAGGRMWRQHSYQYPYYTGFSDGFSIYVGDESLHAARTLSISPWSPPGRYDLIAPMDDTTGFVRWMVTDDAFLGQDVLNLGFESRWFWGARPIPGASSFVLSGMYHNWSGAYNNQLWIAYPAGGGWMTRWRR